jgi:predicted nucleic acid-binding protein
VGILIDTNILIGWEKGRLDLAAQFTERAEEDVFVSVVTFSELIHGVHRAKDPGIVRSRTEFVEQVIAQFPSLAIDLVTARIHARLWADLEAVGTPIGAHDTWIAATSLQHGLTLVTDNVREFQRIPGLSVENWLVP